VLIRVELIAMIGLASGAVLSGGVKFGDRPPEIHFDKILPDQPVANVRFDSFVGKVVVVEMCATWCGPCVAAIPRLNGLAKQFKDQVVFVSVSDEEPVVVETFLKKQPIEGLVGIAHTESPLARWGVWGVPTTFLIDVTGKIAGSTDADRVNAATIEGLLRGVPLPAVELTVRASDEQAASAPGRIGRNLLAYNGSIKTLISRFWETRYARISGDALDDHTMYQVSIALPRADPDHFHAEARDVIAAALRINVKRDVRDCDVWVLTKNESTPASLQPPGTITEINNSGLQPAIPSSLGWWIKVLNTEVPFISEFLESAVGRPVLDETGITGRYDFKVIYDNPEGEGWIDVVRKAGFKIERTRRPVEFLVVSHAESRP
jgi:uncharacterized protein (TIGR03435 family)